MSIDEQTKQLDGINDQLQRHILVESQIMGYQSSINELKKALNALIQRKHSKSTLVSEKLKEVNQVFEVGEFV